MPYPVFQRSASFCSPLQFRLIQVGIASLTCTVLTLTLAQAPASSQTQNGGSTSPSGAAPAQSNTRPTLRLGSEGESVSELQALLKLLGYYSGSVDGVYRANTAAAVSAFQQAVGLQADGIVGSATWNQLLPPSPTATAVTAPAPAPAPASAPAPSVSPSPAPAPATSGSGNASSQSTTSEEDASIDLPVLRIGMRGPAVARLQERLTTLGFYEGAIDGVFGAETQTAVQAAQSSFDLEPDGVVGADTWTALLR